MTFRLKVHKYNKERLVAICDSKICGKNVVYNGLILKIKEQFYGDNDYSSDEVLIEINKCTSLNAFGKEICDLLISRKIVHPESVLWVDHHGKKIGYVILVK